MRKRRIVGSVIVNPRPKRRKARKAGKARVARRRVVRTSSSRKRRTVRANPRRRLVRAPSRAGIRRRIARRTMARRPLIRRARRPGVSRRPRMLRRLRPMRRLAVRRNPGHTRRNPYGMVSKAQGMLRKIPLVGTFLANVFGFLPSSILGAVSVEPVSMLAQLGARVPWLANINAPLFFALSGAALATVVGFMPFIPVSIRKNLQIAMASASGGVAYFMYRNESMGDGANAAPSLDELADTSSGGGISGLLGFGEPNVLVGDRYGDPNFAASVLGDVYYSGADMTVGEIQVALSGPKQWSRQFANRRSLRRQVQRRQGMPAPSPSAGQEGAQWDWLIALVGFDAFQQIAALPDNERRATIARMRQGAINAYARSMQSGQLGTVYAMQGV